MAVTHVNIQHQCTLSVSTATYRTSGFFVKTFQVYHPRLAASVPPNRVCKALHPQTSFKMHQSEVHQSIRREALNRLSYCNVPDVAAKACYAPWQNECGRVYYELVQQNETDVRFASPLLHRELESFSTNLRCG